MNTTCKFCKESKVAFDLEVSSLRYSIGDVSRVLGMTTAALHFYEKEGIIDTPKEESGRRYYEEADLFRLISAKKYRSMGVTVRDIAKQFSADGMTGEQVLTRIREKREEAAEMAREYERLKNDIDRLILLSERGLAAENTVDIRYVEDMVMLRAGNGGLIPRDKVGQSVMQRCLDAMPAVNLSIVSELQDARAAFALMMPAQRADELGLGKEENVIRPIPGGMALHACVPCGEEQYETPEIIFRPILSFAREHRFVQKGAMWGNLLFVDCSGGVRRHYYDTYMIFE